MAVLAIVLALVGMVALGAAIRAARSRTRGPPKRADASRFRPSDVPLRSSVGERAVPLRGDPDGDGARIAASVASLELRDATFDARDLHVGGDAAPAERAGHREPPVEVGQLAPGGFELRIGRRGHRSALYVAPVRKAAARVVRGPWESSSA